MATSTEETLLSLRHTCSHLMERFISPPGRKKPSVSCFVEEEELELFYFQFPWRMGFLLKVTAPVCANRFTMETITGDITMRAQPAGFISARAALLILFLFFSYPVFSKEGVEVSVKEIPANAFKYLQINYPEARKAKYFIEMDEAGKTRYEVKLKYKGDKFDLTFDSSGGIVEVEKEIDCATIEDAAHHKIIGYFNSNFTRYHIYKCEEVASGGENFFEVKLRGKRPDGEYFFEAFFTRAGDFKEIIKEEVASLPILN